MLSRAEKFNDGLGKATAWLTLCMVLVMFVVVVMRKLFDVGFIWMQESVTWMHAVVFMAGAAYTLHCEDHVRVDVFYSRMTAIGRARVDALGVLLLLWPLCAFLAFSAWDFVATSWALHESSRESGGLPFPFVSLLKSVLLLMPITVAVQGLSLLVKSIGTLLSSGPDK